MKKLSLEELFSTQKKNLDDFFNHIDLESVEALLDRISNTKGIIFVTGVGKSGFIAQKIASTLVSMGIKSMFMPPTNALHGDLGIVDSDDSFMVLSKSGESDELLSLIPFIRNRGAPITAIVSKENGRLAKASDYVILLPMGPELCPYNIIPTTSTEVQLIFGDILAVALMQKRDLTLHEFALNHPAGKIGKRLSLKVDDLMLKGDKIPFCSREDKLMDVLVELSEKRCGCLLVVDKEKRLEGIFTDGDLRRALQNHGSKISEFYLKDLKINSPKTISPEKMAWEAMQLMESDQKHPFMVLPVVDENRVVKGLIKMHDIVQSGIN